MSMSKEKKMSWVQALGWGALFWIAVIVLVAAPLLFLYGDLLSLSNPVRFFLLLGGPALSFWFLSLIASEWQIQPDTVDRKKVDACTTMKLVKFASIFLVLGLLNSPFVLDGRLIDPRAITDLASGGDLKEVEEIFIVATSMFGGYMMMLISAALLIFNMSLSDKGYMRALRGLIGGITATVMAALYMMLSAWLKGGILIYFAASQVFAN